MKEIIIILWIFIGLWISYKRSWYNNASIYFNVKQEYLGIIGNVLFAPIILVIVFIKQFIIRKWK